MYSLIFPVFFWYFAANTSSVDIYIRSILNNQYLIRIFCVRKRLFFSGQIVELLSWNSSRIKLHLYS